MLISVHLPKTAGASFLSTLEKKYDGSVVRDYSDLPVHKTDFERNSLAVEAAGQIFRMDFDSVSCIHGHFLPFKYLLLRDLLDVRFVTWMRNPVDRLVSHYEFWMRDFRFNAAGALHRRVVSEGWSFRKFCFSEEVRNLYSKFLWAFPLEYFDFIGIFENYDQDHDFFVENFLRDSISPVRRNSSLDTDHFYTLDPILREEIQDFHSVDMRLYLTALDMRRKRVGN